MIPRTHVICWKCSSPMSFIPSTHPYWLCFCGATYCELPEVKEPPHDTIQLCNYESYCTKKELIRGGIVYD